MLMRMSNCNFYTLLVGMPNDTTTLENTLTVSYKVKHTLATGLSKLVPKHLPLSRVQQTIALRPNLAASPNSVRLICLRTV